MIVIKLYFIVYWINYFCFYFILFYLEKNYISLTLSTLAALENKGYMIQDTEHRAGYKLCYKIQEQIQ